MWICMENPMHASENLIGVLSYERSHEKSNIKSFSFAQRESAYADCLFWIIGFF